MASKSSIHYKFGNDVELKRLAFEGIHISLDELKKSVSQIEGINMDFVDLSLSNADTKREYEGACFIPRNSTVILKRVPRHTPMRMPKMNAPETSGAVSQKRIEASPIINHINQEDFAKMSEEERLKHVKMISTQKYNPINFMRKNHGFQHGTVPPDFRCHRCGNLGHHPKQCLMQNVRKTTGIPSEELMDASPTDPNALLHQSGRYVIPILHYKARETRKLVDKALIEREQQLANNKITLNTNNSKSPVPQELECPLCHELLEDALLAPCCGESFCAECIQNYMLKCSQTDEGITQCPTCPGSKPLSIDKLIPNKRIRDTVKKHKSFIAAANKTNTSGAIPLAAVPVAAHELSPNSHSLNASPMNGISSSQNPSQIIQLPTVNLTNVGSPTILPAKPMIVVDLTKPPPILNSAATSSPTPDICKADLPPGINPTSLCFNPNIPPPNMSLQLPPTNLTNFNHPMVPTMEYYGMINGSMNSPSTWQHSNDVPPGLCRASCSSSDMPPGTELNSYHPRQNKDDIYERSEYFGDITLDEISKINKSWDAVRSDEEPIQKRHERHRESRDARIERRSRSPRDRTSRQDRDRRERDKERDDDERRRRTSRVYHERNGRRDKEEKSARKEKDEKSVRREKNERSIRKDKEEDVHKDERVSRRHEKSSRKEKEDGRKEERIKKREEGHDKTSHRNRKDIESSKHKKKSSKKEKKKRKDHST